MKNYIYLLGVSTLLLALSFGYTKSENATIQTASLGEYTLARVSSQSLNDVFLSEPLMAGERVVKGEFSNKLSDVYVYVYVNNSFKAFERVVNENSFEIQLTEELKGQDKVQVFISAYDRYDRYASRKVTVDGVAPVDTSKQVQTAIIKFGPFSVDKAIKGGDQKADVLFNQVITRGMLTVKVDGVNVLNKFVFRSDRVNIDFGQKLKKGQVVELSLSKYDDKKVLNGSITVQ